MTPAPPHPQLIITHGQLEFLEWLAEQSDFSLSDAAFLSKICRDIRSRPHSTTPSERDNNKLVVITYSGNLDFEKFRKEFAENFEEDLKRWHINFPTPTEAHPRPPLIIGPEQL